MKNKPKILLSFDIEEFDLPREHGAEISLKEGVRVSSSGLEKILNLLKTEKVKATFFVTGNFANENPALVKKIQSLGHEVGCHGVDHFNPKPSDVSESKKILEKTLDAKVFGYRQPRMQKIDYDLLKQNNFLYDSSVNPAFIPGRYNHFDIPRGPYLKNDLVELPTSVSTSLRIPLFWLALHIFPLSFYLALAKISFKKSGYLATYFHPWEFADLSAFNSVPKFIKYNSGDKLVKKLQKLIQNLKKTCEFETYSDFVSDFLGESPKTKRS